LECGSQSLLWELKFRKKLLHLIDCHASSILCICFLQRVIELQLLKVHLRHVDLVQEDLVADLPSLLRVKFFAEDFELSWQYGHIGLHEPILKVLVAYLSISFSSFPRQAVSQKDQVTLAASLHEVGKDGFLHFEGLDCLLHVCKAGVTDGLLAQNCIVLDPRVLEGLRGCVPLLHIFLYQALQELFGLCRVS